MKKASCLIPLIQHRAIFVASLGMVVLLLTAVSSATASSSEKLPVIKVFKDRGLCVLAELAATPKMLARGLMFRDKLPEGRGMLFILPRTDFWHFWMKNTRIPLDIIWLDKARKIVSIAADAQPCLNDPCPDYIPKGKAFYVLEVASGVADKWNLKTGDSLTFEVPEEILRKARR